MDNKVIVITGASEGIGAEFARQLGAAGHRVVLAARRKKELEEVAQAAGNDAVVHVTDVTRRAEVEKLRDVALEACGRIDVWVNNAGRGISKPVLELTDEDFDQIMTVNVKSALYGMQAVLPYFQKQTKGHLVNVSSFLGRVPVATIRSVYSAAKAALNSLTANVRMDLQKEFPDIHISVVMPGAVTTDFGKNAIGGTPPVRPPAGAVPQPQNAEEVAAAMVSLIEHPRVEIFTNPVLEGIAKRYYDDIGAFEQQMLNH